MPRQFSQSDSLVQYLYLSTNEFTSASKIQSMLLSRVEKQETGSKGELFFLLSQWVMSSSFRLCPHNVVAALSIHCHHGYKTASDRPPGSEQADRNLWMLWPIGAQLSDVTELHCLKWRFAFKMSRVRVVLTHRLNKEDIICEGGHQCLTCFFFPAVWRWYMSEGKI